LFINGESLFLSTVLTIYENNERKDQILILFPTRLVILHQIPKKTSASDELIYDGQISLTSQFSVSVIDMMHNGYKYCFEISGLNLSRIVFFFYYIIFFLMECVSILKGVNMQHMKFICSTAYDLKTWVEMLKAMAAKILPVQDKAQTLSKVLVSF
jgi:hypothetical protein